MLLKLPGGYTACNNSIRKVAIECYLGYLFGYFAAVKNGKGSKGSIR